MVLEQLVQQELAEQQEPAEQVAVVAAEVEPEAAVVAVDLGTVDLGTGLEEPALQERLKANHLQQRSVRRPWWCRSLGNQR